MITVRIAIDTTLAADWARALGELSEGMARAVEHTVDVGAHVARTEHLYVNKTGTLEKSTEGVMLVRTRERAEGEVRATADYAEHVEKRGFTFMKQAEEIMRLTLPREIEAAARRVELGGR